MVAVSLAVLMVKVSRRRRAGAGAAPDADFAAGAASMRRAGDVDADGYIFAGLVNVWKSRRAGRKDLWIKSLCNNPRANLQPNSAESGAGGMVDKRFARSSNKPCFYSGSVISPLVKRGTLK